VNRLKARLITPRVIYIAALLALFAGKAIGSGMSDGGGWG
jgi:hypothetical protein